MQISTTIPVNPATGHLVYDPASGRVYVWTGAQWNSVTPTGSGSATVSRAVSGPLGMARDRDEAIVRRAISMIAYGAGGGIAGFLFVEALKVFSMVLFS